MNNQSTEEKLLYDYLIGKHISQKDIEDKEILINRITARSIKIYNRTNRRKLADCNKGVVINSLLYMFSWPW
jgi:hypothetical protein